MIQWFKKQKKIADEPVATKVSDNERIYAVGDIHGRVDLLSFILSKISDDIDERRDDRMTRVIFLGDYVDRGDHSKEVLELLAEFGADVGPSATFLRGNHEAAMMAFLKDPLEAVDWLGWGGVQTIASFGIQPPRTPYQDNDLKVAAYELGAALGPLLEFVEKTELMARSGDYVFAHAGIDPAVPLDEQSESSLLWGSGGFRSAKALPGLRVVHGHYDRYEPEVLPHRVGIDTGAYYSGRLTALRLDDEEQLIVADAMDLS